MSLYCSIDEGYSVTKISSLKKVLFNVSDYYMINGEKPTLKIIKKELEKYGQFNVYDYEEDDLQEAKENGSVRYKDWYLKISKL